MDAGDIGAGHTVTAIYEITEVGSSASMLGERRYSENKKTINPSGNEYGFLKIRYKLPKEKKSRLISKAITINLEVSTFARAKQETRFSVGVAGFSQLLKQSKYINWRE